jgi:hypothetical protein
VRSIGREQLLVLRDRVQIIGTVGQAETGLFNADDVAIGILVIDRHVHADRREQLELRAPHQRRDVFMRLRGGDRVEPGLSGADARRVDRLRVEEGSIIIIHLLRGRSCL